MQPRIAAHAGYARARSASRTIPQNASESPPSKPVPGSGIVLTGATLVCAEKFVAVVVPSRLTPIVKANPSVVSLVRAGTVPAASANTLKANVLPEVDPPSGELNAGPNKLTVKERVEPYVNPWK